MNKIISLDAQILEMNERLKTLEARVPIPASIPEPEPIRWTGIRRHLYVVPFTSGYAAVDCRKPCWNMSMAMAVAEDLARELGRSVKRVRWNQTIAEIMPSRAVQGLSWAEAEKIQKGHDAVLLVEECQADWSGTRDRAGATGSIIHKWIFSNPMPSWMIEEDIS
jgi:hypothetical protein